MSTISLKNFTIHEKQTTSGETYFIIKDQEQNQVYFCFQDQLKEGWQDLLNNKENIKELELEYLENEKGNKVISFYSFCLIKNIQTPYNGIYMPLA